MISVSHVTVVAWNLSFGSARADQGSRPPTKLRGRVSTDPPNIHSSSGAIRTTTSTQISLIGQHRFKIHIITVDVSSAAGLDALRITS